MIQILPMENQQRENSILKTLLKKEDKGRVLVMSEQGKELGFVSLALRDRKLIIFEFVLTKPCDFENLDMEQDFYIDTLMRSAASYGETNGARFIETETNIYNNFLVKRKFSVDESHAFTKMSTIVHYT